MISKPLRNGVDPCLVLFLLFAAVLACSRGSNKCTATLTYQGKTYTGIGKKDDAVSFACNKYCIADDSEYEAMYRIWLDSAEGRAAGRPPKEEAIYKSKRLLDFVTTTCANRCVEWTKSGRAQAETKCD
ncbi:MAG: hypothetical protein WAM70_15055 [Pyrinomonadaceae bacterium]